MAKRMNHVHITVDKMYFDKCFEPQRRKLEKKLGVSFSQKSFTAYLARTQYYPKSPKKPSRRIYF